MSSRPPIQAIAYPAFILFVAVFLFPEWQDLAKVWWENIIYSHGLAVLAAVLALLWSRRKDFGAGSLSPSLPWLGALVACTLLMIVGRAGDILTLRLFVLPFLVASWGCALWGQRFFRKAAPAIMLLIFAVPIWDDMSPIFQFLTVAANQAFLHLTHIQATIHRFFISTPRGTFHVADGCSGVRYLMSGLFIASFYSILYVRNWRRAALLIAIGGALAIVGNWIRVLGVIIVGYETHMQSPMVQHHEKWGWLVFVLFAMIPFFLLARRLEGTQRATEENSPRKPRLKLGGWLTMPLATALIVGSLPVLTLVQHYSSSQSSDPMLVRLPPGKANWKGPIPHANFWEPHFIKPDFNQGAIYVSPHNAQVELFLVGYQAQSQGRELVYYQNELYKRDRWEQLEQRVIPLASPPAAAPKKVLESILKQPNVPAPIIIWSWYRQGDYQSTSKLMVKLVGGLQDLKGSSSGEMFAVAMRCHDADIKSCTKQREHLQDFIYQFIAPHVNRLKGAQGIKAAASAMKRSIRTSEVASRRAH